MNTEKEDYYPAPDELRDAWINDADAGSFEGEEERLSSREREECDRLDYANEVAETDPDRAAEIRMGA